MPVKIDGRVMIDGGIYNPIPFDHLRGLADIVVAVDVVGGPDGDGETIPSRIDSLFGATQLMMQSIITMKMQAGAPDILLRPDVGRFRVLDFLRAQELLAATSGTKDEVKRALAERIDRWRKGI
jgi:NTE family protein